MYNIFKKYSEDSKFQTKYEIIAYLKIPAKYEQIAYQRKKPWNVLGLYLQGSKLKNIGYKPNKLVMSANYKP